MLDLKAAYNLYHDRHGAERSSELGGRRLKYQRSSVLPVGGVARKSLLARRRQRIDDLDAKLVRTLAERLLIARSLAGLKQSVRDGARERAVLGRIRRLVGRKELEPAAVAVYREIIKHSRRLQRRRA